MRIAKNMAGKVVGRLLVLERAGVHPTRKGALWRCWCQCGNETIVEGRLLRNGTTSSCGCFRKEGHPTHGMTNTPTYYSWAAMLKRCSNPNHHAWKNYGGRGIKVCPRWRESFANFFADMGERPSTQPTIDRIDNDGDYEPGNCRWITRKQQNGNRRDNRRIVHDGETKILTEWAELHGLSCATLSQRLAQGIPLGLALTMPLKKRRPKKINQSAKGR